jgi:hypothetical protein
MQQLQNQRNTDWRIAAEVHLGKDYTAVSLTANRCTLATHPSGDVHLTHWCTHDCATCTFGDVVDDSAR